MPNREKVIKAWECCKNPFDRICEKCPFEKECCHDGIPDFVVAKAVDLLKEQEDLGTELTNAVELIHKKNERIEKLLKEKEAVEPVFEVKSPNVVGQFHCGNCHHAFCYSHYKFCPECGRKVNWNEETKVP